MRSRLLAGVAGMAVLLISVTWPRYFAAPISGVMGGLAGYFSVLGILLGAYLLFHSISGEWLPNLRNRER